MEISFVYLTDTASVGDGLLLDNIKISGIDFFDDAENDDAGWDSAGFSRIQARVPQHFSLVLLRPRGDGTTTAEFYTFEGGEPFIVDCPEGNCTFAVSAVDRDIRARASFSIRTD